MFVAILHAAFMQLFPFLINRFKTRIPYFRHPVVDMQTDQIIISILYICLRSIPVDPNVVRLLVSRNVENRGIMTCDRVTV